MSHFARATATQPVSGSAGLPQAADAVMGLLHQRPCRPDDGPDGVWHDTVLVERRAP